MVSLFFPNRCLSCGMDISLQKSLCEECAELIDGPVMAPFSLPYLKRAYSYWRYETPLKELLQTYKFRDRPRMAGIFADMLFDMLCVFSDNIKVVVPVPTTVQAFRKRGFDTNYLIMKSLRKRTSIKVEDILVAGGGRTPQSRLGVEERKESVKGKFHLRERTSAERVLLFDDVVTSGATASQCAKVLLEGGVKEVVLLAIAKAKGP